MAKRVKEDNFKSNSKNTLKNKYIVIVAILVIIIALFLIARSFFTGKVTYSYASPSPSPSPSPGGGFSVKDLDGGVAPEYPSKVQTYSDDNCQIDRGNDFEDSCQDTLGERSTILFEAVVHSRTGECTKDTVDYERVPCTSYCYNLYGGSLNDGYCEMIRVPISTTDPSSSGFSAQCTCPQHG